MLAFGIGLFSACQSSPTAGINHGTDTPNALTVTVDDSNNQAKAGIKVYALIKVDGKKDSLLQGITDSSGRYTFDRPFGAKIWISASLNTPKDLKFGIDSLVDSSAQLSIKLSQCLKKRSLSNDSLDLFIGLGYGPSSDLFNAHWDSTSINQTLEKGKQRGYRGIFVSLIGEYSPIPVSGPVLDSVSSAHLKWLHQKTKDLGLELRLSIFDPSATRNNKLESFLGNPVWIFQQYYTNLAVPITKLLCNTTDCVDTKLQVIAANSALPHFSYASTFAMIGEWKVSNQNSLGGLELKTINSPLNFKETETIPHSADFFVLGSKSGLSPLLYPSEMLAGSTPIVIRWQEEQAPSSTALMSLNLGNYSGLIIPDSLVE